MAAVALTLRPTMTDDLLFDGNTKLVVPIQVLHADHRETICKAFDRMTFEFHANSDPVDITGVPDRGLILAAICREYLKAIKKGRP
jgi:hypothetical protein